MIWIVAGKYCTRNFINSIKVQYKYSSDCGYGNVGEQIESVQSGEVSIFD